MYLLLIIGLLVPQQSDAEKQLHKQVTEFARNFYFAFENGNVEAVLPMTTLPWYQDGQAIIRDADTQRIELKKVLDQRDAKLGKRVPEVKLVAAYAHMKTRMSLKDRELLEQVVRDDDYLALVMLKPGNGPSKNSDNMVLLVRIKDGKAGAIGIKHTQ